MHRDEVRILRKLKVLSTAGGEDRFYYIPISSRRQPALIFVEGRSIKMTSDLARLYGNCAVEVRVSDLGNPWLVEARFSDLETGYTLKWLAPQQIALSEAPVARAPKSVDAPIYRVENGVNRSCRPASPDHRRARNPAPSSGSPGRVSAPSAGIAMMGAPRRSRRSTIAPRSSR